MTRHSWKILKHDQKDELAECNHCKIRRNKYFLNGKWIVKYFRDRSAVQRFAPDCIRIIRGERKVNPQSKGIAAL